MKKRIVELVDKRLAVFKMKQTHNRYMEMSTFIFEVVCLLVFLFTLIPVVGLIGNLNAYFNYVFYMSNIIIIFTYFFIRYLYEVRYKHQNRLVYRVLPVIIVDVVSLILVLVIGNSFLGLIIFGVYMNTINMIVVGSMSVLILIVGSIFIILVDRVEKHKRFSSIITTGVIVGIFNLLFYTILDESFIPILLVINYVMVIVLLLTKEVMQQHLEMKTLRLYLTLTSFMLIVLYTISMPVNDVVQVTGSDNMIDEFQTVLDLNEEVINNVVSDQGYIYFSVLHGNGCSYKIYDKEFNYVGETDVLVGQNYMYSEQGVFSVQTRTIDNFIEYVSMYQMNDDYTFELLFKEPLLNIFRSSVVFDYLGDDYILIQYEGLDEADIFKVVNKRLEEVASLPEGIIYQSETTLVENGEAGLIALSDFGPEYRFFDFTQTDEFIRYAAYDDGYVLIREDMSFYTIKDTLGNVLVESVDLGDIYADFDIVDEDIYFYDHVISKTFEAQINRICKFDFTSGTCVLYGFDSAVFRIDDEFFQIFDGEVFVLNDTFGLNVVNTTSLALNTAYSFMLIPCLLFATFDVKTFIYVEVTNDDE